jgi:hypothetical protein
LLDDRHAAGSGGRHWPRGALAYHTTIASWTGKSTWRGKFVRPTTGGLWLEIRLICPGPHSQVSPSFCVCIRCWFGDCGRKVLSCYTLPLAGGRAAHLVLGPGSRRRGGPYTTRCPSMDGYPTCHSFGKVLIASSRNIAL